MNKITRLSTLLLVLVVSTIAIPPNPCSQWNTDVLTVIKSNSLHPVEATRVLSIVHTSIAASMVRTKIILGSDYTKAEVATAQRVAAEYAGYFAAASVFPLSKRTFAASLKTMLASEDEDAAYYTLAKDIGIGVAAAIVASRSVDGSQNYTAYTAADPSVLGRWQPTPSALTTPPFDQEWAYVRPFVLKQDDINDAVPAAPPSLGSTTFATDYAEVESMGNTTNSGRTSDQSQIATFWADGLGTRTPPGHWNRIAATIATDQNMTLFEWASLFSVLNVAMFETGIATWRTLTKYDTWRPVTAIRTGIPSAGLASNSTWTSFKTTPPYQEYVSDYSAFAAAASRVLILFLGTDNIAFDSQSDDDSITRSYLTISSAATEAGKSTIYAGTNFQFSNAAGHTLGTTIGNTVYQRIAGKEGTFIITVDLDRRH